MLADKQSYRFSTGASYLKRSIMRDLLKHAVDPNIISLAGGLPASDCLPVAQFQECLNHVIARDGASAMQYSPQYMPLRAWIADYMNSRGVACTPEQIFITNGNQQGLSILSRLFLDQGDTAVIEEAVFTGIQQGTRGVGAKTLTIPTDLASGADIDALEAIYAREDVRLTVLIPDFHNPLGVSLSLEKRQQVAALSAHYGVPLVEDDAYSMLRFSGDILPPIRAYDDSGYVFYLGSFSKMLAPGLRLGWMVIPTDLMPKVMVIRESIDLETSTLTQRAVYEFLSRGYLAPHLAELNRTHQTRANALLASLDQHFGDIAHWTTPDGGLFLWLSLPENINTWDLLPKAIEQGVVYIPGGAFAINGGMTHTMRLNFSNISIEKIEAGVRRLADVVKSK